MFFLFLPIVILLQTETIQTTSADYPSFPALPLEIQAAARRIGVARTFRPVQKIFNVIAFRVERCVEIDQVHGFIWDVFAYYG